MQALVLSGGGMFSAFQVGAWGVLREHLTFDRVVGASAGALNAWAIAAAIPQQELEAMWLAVGEAGKPAFHLPRFWMDGFLQARGMEEMVHTMVARYRPRMPISIVVTQGWRLEHRLYHDTEITAEHLLASCAVPFMLPARRLENRLSLDGGLRVACPCWAARELGATRIVAVNVWTHLPWWWALGFRRVKIARPNTIFIEPGAALGPLRQAAIWDRARASQWISQGRLAAHERLGAIQEAFARQ